MRQPRSGVRLSHTHRAKTSLLVAHAARAERFNGALVDIRACVDNEGYECTQPASGANNECKEDNKQGNTTGVGCKQPT